MFGVFGVTSEKKQKKKKKKLYISIMFTVTRVPGAGGFCAMGFVPATSHQNVRLIIAKRSDNEKVKVSYYLWRSFT